MSHDTLRDLLHDRVADETTIDLSGRAWRAGRRVRRRRGLAVVGGVAAGAVAASAVVGWVGSPPAEDRVVAPAPAGQSDGGTDSGRGQVRTRTAPDPAVQATLPWVADGPLTRVLDLDADLDRPMPPGPGVVAFARGDEVVVSDATGPGYDVDVSRLDPVTTPDGRRVPATSASMLSPDGRRLVFAQDGAVVVHTLATGEWQTIRTGGRATYGAAWLDDDTVGIPQDADDPWWSVLPKVGPEVRTADLAPLSPAPPPPDGVVPAGPDREVGRPFGPVRSLGSSRAQAWIDRSGDASSGEVGRAGPDAVVADTAGGRDVLQLATLSSGTDPRTAGCCPVAGWLDDETLVYESRQRGRDSAALVAWRVGTDEFRLVSLVQGAYEVASYADLARS